MPTLPASGYAVPVAPSVEPLTAPPGGYQDIRAPAGAFGAGMAEGMQAFGQQAAQAAEHQYARQQFLNLTEADKLGAQLDDELHRQKYGDPTAGTDPVTGQMLVPGFKNRLGSDAIDYIKSGEPAKAFGTAIDRIAASASNPASRQMFIQQSRERRKAFDTSLDDHFSSQLLQHNEQVQKSKAAGAATAATAGVDDDNAIKAAGDRFYESYVARAHTNDPATLDVLRQQATADAAEPAIDAALARRDPARAMQIYQNNSAGMPGDRQLKLMAKIQPALDHLLAGRASAGVNEAARVAAASYAEDSGIIAQIDKSVQAVLDADPDKDPTVQADKRHKVRAAIGGSAIDAAIGAENPTRAARLLQTYSDSMAGDKIKDYHNQIQPLIDKQRAAAAASRVRGAPLVPHTPSPDILSGTGLTADQYQTFRSHVAERESESYAQPPNKGGYMGRFQMGRNEIRQTAERLGVPAPSEQQFLSDPALQEKFFENYTLDHHNELMAKSDTYRTASPAERAGILMGAHLGGVGGVMRYLNSNGADDPADSNGTRVSSYVRSMRQRMAVGGALPPAPAAPAPATAPTVPAAPPAVAPLPIPGAASATPSTSTAPAPEPPPIATPGQRAYEADLAEAPTYPDGAARPPWVTLNNERKAQWEAPGSSMRAPAPPAPAGGVEVWGDSLGVGLKARLKTEGTAVGSASPTAILANIKAKPGSYWNGKTVVLASGSNGNQMDKVEETINHLQSVGAKVVAVGYGPKFPEKNAKLRQIAKTYNVPVIDAENVPAGEGVHPSPEGYAAMAGTILRASRSTPSKAPSANAPPPPGMIAPGNIAPPPP